MKELKKDSFILIRPFMVTELNLKGNSLLLYALIHGITVNEGAFYGSIEYMQTWCNASNRNIIDCLKELTNNGLITKKKSGNTVFYTANFISKSEESSQQSEESSLLGVKKVHLESEESSHNILDINNSNKEFLNSPSTKLKSEPPKFKPTKTVKKPYVTAEEKHKQYLSSIPSDINVISEKCADKLVKHLIRLQNSQAPAKNKLAWQDDFAHFLISENKTESEILSVIDFAMTGWWADKIFSAEAIIKQYGKLYQQSHSKLSNRQTDDTVSRVNKNTSNKDYTIF